MEMESKMAANYPNEMSMDMDATCNFPPQVFGFGDASHPVCGEVPIPISDFSSNPLLVPQPVQPWLNVVVAEGAKDDDDDFISTPRSRLLGMRKREIIRPRDLLTQGCTPQQIEERLLDQLQPLMMENSRLTNQLEHYESKINRLTNRLEHYESEIIRLTNQLEH